MNTDLRLALAINRLSVLKSNEKLLLAEVVNTVEFYSSLDYRTLGRVIGRPLRAGTVFPVETLKAAERDYRFCTDRGVRMITFWDSQYPAALREIFDPPFVLFVRGTLPDPAVPGIAVVGTREPTVAADLAANQLARGIAAAGYPVISGLARGIDAAAHKGSLRASRDCESSAMTGAVLGCGIDRVCPVSHRSLAAEILGSGGFLLSEYSPGVGTAKYHFPARNRIISGISRGVVVVQAPAKSGALITADYALDQGRDLFVHAAGIIGETGAGSRELAEDGARIVDGPAGIFEEWGVDLKPAPVAETAGLNPADVATTGAETGRHLAADLRHLVTVESSDG